MVGHHKFWRKKMRMIIMIMQRSRFWRYTGALDPVSKKQTQESLENGFPETTFQETNAPLVDTELYKAI
jgi:hypothetical protein